MESDTLSSTLLAEIQNDIDEKSSSNVEDRELFDQLETALKNKAISKCLSHPVKSAKDLINRNVMKDRVVVAYKAIYEYIKDNDKIPYDIKAQFKDPEITVMKQIDTIHDTNDKKPRKKIGRPPKDKPQVTKTSTCKDTPSAPKQQVKPKPVQEFEEDDDQSWQENEAFVELQDKYDTLIKDHLDLRDAFIQQKKTLNSIIACVFKYLPPQASQEYLSNFIAFV